MPTDVVVLRVFDVASDVISSVGHSVELKIINSTIVFVYMLCFCKNTSGSRFLSRAPTIAGARNCRDDDSSTLSPCRAD